MGFAFHEMVECFTYDILIFSFQAQYMFIFKAIYELICCGLTDYPANIYGDKLQRLATVDPASGQTGMKKQFEVRIEILVCILYFLITDN